uniref:Thymidine phosphorylase n=1 Tax=Cacopsylla melanoneura TaxID=428564 RepID=A0A8D8XTM9_9HEMI
MSVGIVELLRKKRSGNELTAEEMKKFVDLCVSGMAEESQIGAMLMAMFINGLSTEETIDLTKSMVQSGETLSWSTTDIVVDKHSTGGVGDKVSIPLVPALAACGLKVPMVSGRGLDFSGGTLDKLESIPGYQVNCSIPDLKSMLDNVGCFIAGANKELTPGDQILYKVRDVTATVDNLSLCAASILSKKVAEGTKYLVIDVKVGEASFFKTHEKAKAMSELLIKVSKGLNLEARAVMTKMNSPIGFAVGNALEIEESILCLRNEGPPHLHHLVEELGGHLLEMSQQVSSLEEGRTLIRHVLKSGLALNKFQEMLVQHGVSSNIAETLCHGQMWNVLPRAQYVTCLHTKTAGVIEDINGIALAKVTHALGAGRTYASQPLDYSVGIKLTKACGDFVVAGEVWVEVHHTQSKEEIQLLLQDVEWALTVREDPSDIDHAKLVLEVVS